MNKSKKGIMKKVCLAAGLAAIMMATAACGTTAETPKKVGEKTASTSAESSKQDTAKNAPKVFKVGDVIQTKEYKLVVNGVRTLAQDKSGFLTAENGKEYFLVDCTVENISDKEQVVSSMMMFKIVDKDGMQYNQEIFTDANGQLDGTVAPTRKIRGEYVVQAPKGKKGLELEFDASLSGSGQVIVELN